jgi:hypothetical protein
MTPPDSRTKHQSKRKDLLILVVLGERMLTECYDEINDSLAVVIVLSPFLLYIKIKIAI